jgi:predicted DNA binding CopG/RHH family protein
MSQQDLDEREVIEMFNEFASKYGKREAKILVREMLEDSGLTEGDE